MDELITKVGFDLTAVDSGTKAWKQKTAEASGEVQKSFYKAESGAKSFKKALHEAYQEGGLMGLGLRLALSPVAGMFALGIASANAFKETLAGLNSRWDDISAHAAKGFGGMKDVIKDANKEIRGEQRDWDKWLKGQSTANEKITTDLENQLELMKAQSSVQDQILEKNKKRALDSIKGKVASGTMTKEQGATAEADVEKTFTDRQRYDNFKKAQDELGVRKSAAEALRKQRDAQGNELARLGNEQMEPKQVQREKLRLKQIKTLEGSRADTLADLARVKGDINSWDPMSIKSGILAGSGGGKFILDQQLREKAALEQQLKLADSSLEKLHGQADSDADRRGNRASRINELRRQFEQTGTQLKGNEKAAGQAALKRNELLATMTPQEKRDLFQEVYKDKLNAFPQNATPAQKADLTGSYKDLQEANKALPNGGRVTWKEMMEREQKGWQKKLSDERKDWLKRNPNFIDNAKPGENQNPKDSITELKESIEGLQGRLEEILQNEGIIVNSISNG